MTTSSVSTKKTYRSVFLPILVLLLPVVVFGGDIVVDGKLKSTTATGAPIEVASSDKVANLNADLLDGLDSTVFVKSLQNVVTVSSTGGDYTSIQAALDSIVDASSVNRYLVKVGPGIYTEQVVMKPHIDIEGSGELVTTITWATAAPTDATIFGADDAELRFLTVEATTGGFYSIAMLNDAVSPRITHTTLRAAGGTIVIALANVNGASSTMVSGHLEASGDFPFGANNNGGSPRFHDVIVEADGGDAYGIANYEVVGAHLQDLHLTVNGSQTASGVYVDASSVTMRGSTVTVNATDSGASEIHGVYSANGSSTTIESCQLTVHGVSEVSSTAGYGIYTDSSLVHAFQSRIDVRQNQHSTGVYNLNAVPRPTSYHDLWLRLDSGLGDTGFHNENSLRVRFSSCQISMGTLYSVGVINVNSTAEVSDCTFSGSYSRIAETDSTSILTVSYSKVEIGVLGYFFGPTDCRFLWGPAGTWTTTCPS